MPLDIGNGGATDDMHIPGVAYFNQVGATVGIRKSTRIYGRASTLGDVVGDDIPVDQPIPDNDDDAFAMSDGEDSFPCNKEFDNDSEDEDNVPYARSNSLFFYFCFILKLEGKWCR